MKYITYVIPSILSILFLSCNSNTENINKVERKIGSSKIQLAGKVYFFGPGFDSTNCEVDAGCDCCADNILFLDDSNFVTISYCMNESSYFKGVYQVNPDRVVLKYNSRQVDKNVSLELETDTTGIRQTEYIIVTKKSETTTVTLLRFDCNGTICFITDGEDKSFGSLNKDESIDKLRTEMQQDSIWDKLLIEEK